MAHPVWTPAIVPRATHRLQLANNLFHTYSTVLTHGATYAHGTDDGAERSTHDPHLLDRLQLVFFQDPRKCPDSGQSTIPHTQI